MYCNNIWPVIWRNIGAIGLYSTLSKTFRQKCKRTGSKLPEHFCEWKRIFCYLKKCPYFEWRILGNF